MTNNTQIVCMLPCGGMRRTELDEELAPIVLTGVKIYKPPELELDNLFQNVTKEQDEIDNICHLCFQRSVNDDGALSIRVVLNADRKYGEPIVLMEMAINDSQAKDALEVLAVLIRSKERRIGDI